MVITLISTCCQLLAVYAVIADYYQVLCRIFIRHLALNAPGGGWLCPCYHCSAYTTFVTSYNRTLTGLLVQPTCHSLVICRSPPFQLSANRTGSARIPPRSEARQLQPAAAPASADGQAYAVFDAERLAEIQSHVSVRAPSASAGVSPDVCMNALHSDPGSHCKSYNSVITEPLGSLMQQSMMRWQAAVQCMGAATQRASSRAFCTRAWVEAKAGCGGD